jgi:hypothetical protein
LREAVDHVCLKRRENAHEAETEGNEGDDGDNPVNFVVGSPTVPVIISTLFVYTQALLIGGG